MFDLFLNTAKFFTSEDARKSASALIEMIRRSPEWQKDICTLDATIKRSHEEQAILLSDLTSSKMQNLHFPSEAVTAFKAIFLELIRNAFEHGCKSDKDAVKITIEITKTFVGLSIVNPKGRTFNIAEAIDTNKSILAKKPSTLRGRGLLLVKQLADSLKTIESGNGVKAVIYSDRITFDSDIFDELVIITVLTGFYNPGLSERLTDEISKLPRLDTILNLINLSNLPTDLQSEIIKLTIKKASRQKVIALLDDDARGQIMLPADIITYSWKEALTKLGKANLLEVLPFPYKDPEPFSRLPASRILVEDEDDIEEFNIVEENGVVGFCPLHGPYDPTLGKCPFPHRQLPQQNFEDE